LGRSTALRTGSPTAIMSPAGKLMTRSGDEEYDPRNVHEFRSHS
jgi:hypothetical protein